jgi:hypothetical protein
MAPVVFENGIALARQEYAPSQNRMLSADVTRRTDYLLR